MEMHALSISYLPLNQGFQWTDALFGSLWGTAAPLPFTRGNHAGISDPETEHV